MEYSYSEIAEIKSKAFAIVNKELERAIKKGNLQEFLDKYCIVLEEEYMPFEKDRSRILVFGTLAGRITEYIALAKSLGFPKDNIDFISNYDELKRIDVSRYRNSSIYSDIIYGPAPHKQVGMGDVSSLLADMKNNPSEYPRVIEAIANGKLKLSKTSFEISLKKTRYYEKIILDE